MKKQITEKIEIPSEIECSYANGILKCKKGSMEISRKFSAMGISTLIEDNCIIFESKKGNKNQYKIIKSWRAHINNIFNGLLNPFTYIIEACNVHFPMTLKVEKNKLIISNFLGEKTPRITNILPDVKVEIKGQKVLVSSPNKDSAGQTAANLERATKIKNRDRRIFQDGLFIVSTPEKRK